LHQYEDLQKQRLQQLNRAIDSGLEELKMSKKISAKSSYTKLKKKINQIAKEKAK